MPQGTFAGGVVGTGTPESCTEAALDSALVGGGLVTFNCGLEPVTITITSTTTIAQDTTIDGGGRMTISGGGTVGVFAVTRASFPVLNLAIANGRGHNDGGGSANDSGRVTVRNSTLVGNSTGTCSGIPGCGVGGIFSLGGVATVTGSALAANTAHLAGGGIFSPNSIVVVPNSTLAGNSGDGIAVGGVDGGTLTATNSTFWGNAARPGHGGAITVFGRGPAIVSNSIMVNSTAPNCDGNITDGGHNLQWPGNDCGETIPSADPLLDPDNLEDNGGQVTEVSCNCASTPDFFDSCAVGACSCPPEGEPRHLNACDCGEGKCFNGSACVARVEP